jgi:hypothetical protein
MYGADIASAQSLEHNISAIGFLAPLPNSIVSRSTDCPFEVQYQNTGTEDEDNVTLIGRVFAKRYDGKWRIDTINCDTIHIPHWEAGEVKNIAFGIHTMNYGLDLECYSLTSLDQLHKDDTLKTHVGIGYNADIQAVAVLSPRLDTVLPLNTTFNLSGKFMWRGLSAVLKKNVPAQVKIRRWSDNYLVFQADTIIPSITYYDDTVTIGFPNKQGIFDVRNLGKGVYKVAVISKLPDDGDRTNDTTFSYITIANKITETDILIDSLYSPLNNKHFDTNVVPIRIKLRNDGLSKGLNKTFIAKVSTSTGSVIYRDTIFIPLLAKRSTLDTQFADLVISRKGPYYPEYKLEITATPPNEDQLWRDTIRSIITIGEPSKVKLLAITYPAQGDTVIAGTVIKPRVELRALWGNDFKKYKLKLGILNLTHFNYNNNSYWPNYVSDTSMPEFTTDNGYLLFTFPVPRSDEFGIDSISKILSGNHKLTCYMMSDSNKVHDSLSTIFYVSDRTLDPYITIDSILYPGKGDIVNQTTQYSQVLIRNSGPIDIPNIVVHTEVSSSDASNRFNFHDTIKILLSGDSITLQQGPFNPRFLGQYTIETHIACDTLPIGLYYHYPGINHSFIVVKKTSSVSDHQQVDFNLLDVKSPYPNPLSTTTTLTYEVASSGYITMRILDVAGEAIETVMKDAFVSEGKHEVTLDGSHLPSGTYFVEMVVTNAEGMLARKIQPIIIRR